MSKIIFWEGNGCDQNKLGSVKVGDCEGEGHCVTWGDKKTWNLTKTDDWIPNDEARSCTLEDVPEGTVITLYDNSEGDKDDDWTQITVNKRTTNDVCVPSFEQDFSDEWFTENYHKNNGLQGKVSRIEVSVPSK